MTISISSAPKWMKITFALSLAANLAVAGLMAGAMMRHHGPGPGEGRDMGLGPIGVALNMEDRKALREAFLERLPDLRATAAATLRDEFDPLLAAMRAEPFDAAAVGAAMTAITARSTARLETSREVVGHYLQSMPEAARLAFSDRLEAALAKAEARMGARKSGNRP